jgi:uncharacterized membrane protein YecN with MAPEG domain
MLGVLWGILYNDYIGSSNFFYPPLSTTLSEGLEKYIVNGVPVLKVVYIVFIVLLCFATIPASFAVLLYSLNKEHPSLILWHGDEDVLKKQDCRVHFLLSLSLIYFISAWGRMIPLALVAVFDMSVNQTAHYTCAMLGFILILLCNLCLLSRRCVVLVYLNEKLHETSEETASLYPFMNDDRSYRKALRVILIFNFIWFILQLACAIIFAKTIDGRAECTLTFLVVSDMLFQPFDFYFDPHSLEKHQYTKLKEPLMMIDPSGKNI